MQRSAIFWPNTVAAFADSVEILKMGNCLRGNELTDQRRTGWRFRRNDKTVRRRNGRRNPDQCQPAAGEFDQGVWQQGKSSETAEPSM